MNVDRNCESDNRATLGSGTRDYTNLQLVQPTLQRAGGSSGRVSGRMLCFIWGGMRSIVQSFYHKKRVYLGLIAREGFSNVSYIKKCALQHTKSLKESE